MLKLLLGTAASAVLAASAHAAVITPVSATASSTNTHGGFYKVENLINGSGLSGDLHDSHFANMWMTDLGESKAQVTFDLGGLFQLASTDIWQYNFGINQPASNLDRGVKDFRVLVSLDGASFTEIFTGTLDRAPDGSPVAVQTIALSGLARFVQFDILSNYTYGTIYEAWEGSGLSEVRFNSADVPEPASFALVAAGLAAFGFARRRRAI